jgi:hypothetical protein
MDTPHITGQLHKQLDSRRQFPRQDRARWNQARYIKPILTTKRQKLLTTFEFAINLILDHT